MDKPQHPDPLRAVLYSVLPMTRALGFAIPLVYSSVLRIRAAQRSKDLVLFSTRMGRRWAPLFAPFPPQPLCPGSLPSSSTKSSTFRLLPKCPACPWISPPCGPGAAMESCSSGAGGAGTTTKIASGLPLSPTDLPVLWTCIYGLAL